MILFEANVLINRYEKEKSTSTKNIHDKKRGIIFCNSSLNSFKNEEYSFFKKNWDLSCFPAL
ncbi:hypothetical protein DN748_01185 [Sinomicrobium soli]|nr:hypothetical protein DN748_01185 [Sinomicrobium sp. N-1-3-6]